MRYFWEFYPIFSIIPLHGTILRQKNHGEIVGRPILVQNPAEKRATFCQPYLFTMLSLLITLVHQGNVEISNFALAFILVQVCLSSAQTFLCAFHHVFSF